jgi:hypothetical protein
MGKKKAKKVSLKKERYAKFKKDKKVVNIVSPEPSPEEIKQRQVDELTINKFLRFNKNPFTKTIKEKKLKYK